MQWLHYVSFKSIKNSYFVQVFDDNIHIFGLCCKSVYIHIFNPSIYFNLNCLDYLVGFSCKIQWYIACNTRYADGM